MPTGSFTYEPPPPSLSIPATPVGVFKYFPDAEGAERLRPMPNVYCEQIEYHEGPVPPVARFSYILDELAIVFGWPTQFEQLFPIEAAPSPYAFVNDDEIVVLAQIGEKAEVLFHGFAQSPQVDLTGDSQHITFIGLGVAIRCWDTPISFRHQRNNTALAEDPVGIVGVDRGEGTFHSIHARAHFNPEQRGNCLPETAFDEVVDEEEEQPREYPIFTDPALWTWYKDAKTDQPTRWTLSGFARYLLGVHNKEEEFITSPDFTSVAEMLDARKPKDDQLYDPADPETYTSTPITIPDFDVTGHVWIEALDQMLGMHGFEMVFRTETEADEEEEGDQAGIPKDHLEIYRKDQAGPDEPKKVYLPPKGSRLDERYANAAAVHLAWDLGSVRNAIEVEMDEFVIETSFILAPNFIPDALDDRPPNRQSYLKANLSQASATRRKKYREFVWVDGNGQYWDYSSKEMRQEDNPRGAFYQPDPKKEKDKDWVYEGPQVSAFMEPLRDLMATDQDGHPRTAILDVFRPAGVDGRPAKGFHRTVTKVAPPAIDSGAGLDGTWENVPGGWELLEDRIGIRVTEEDPEGDLKTASKMPIPLISGSAAANNADNAFMFRLTIATRRAERIPVIQGMREASPTIYPRWRLIDRHDQYKVEVQYDRDFDFLNADDKKKYTRDDYPKAQAEAVTMRAITEFPPLAGSVTIPTLSLAYKVGTASARSRAGPSRSARTLATSARPPSTPTLCRWPGTSAATPRPRRCSSRTAATRASGPRRRPPPRPRRSGSPRARPASAASASAGAGNPEAWI
jgi:hypothetical protein